jgi:tetratricopeptide (TPR) repeat protein
MKLRGPARRQSRKWLTCSLPALLWMVSLLTPGLRAPAQNAAPARQDRIVALFQQARQAEQRREFSEAARLYDKILALDPKVAEVWTNKGLALYELSKHREALAAFTKAATLKPRLLTPHLFLGIIYLKLGEPEKAIGPLESALRLEPRHPQATCELANARAGLADAYAVLGETDRAIAEMKQALSADTDGSMHYRLGRWYQKNGQTREAAEAFAVSTRLKAEKLKRDTERFTALQPSD